MSRRRKRKRMEKRRGLRERGGGKIRGGGKVNDTLTAISEKLLEGLAKTRNF